MYKYRCPFVVGEDYVLTDLDTGEAVRGLNGWDTLGGAERRGPPNAACFLLFIKKKSGVHNEADSLFSHAQLVVKC